MASEETAFVEANGQEDGENYVIMISVVCAVQQKKRGDRIKDKSGRIKWVRCQRLFRVEIQQQIHQSIRYNRRSSSG